MSSSYGHQIQSASLRDREANDQWGCMHPKCRATPILFVASYRYVTGRKGRTTRAERFFCQVHGDAFAKKNGLTLPDPLLPGPDSQRTKIGDIISRVTMSPNR